MSTPVRTHAAPPTLGRNLVRGAAIVTTASLAASSAVGALTGFALGQPGVGFGALATATAALIVLAVVVHRARPPAQQDDGPGFWLER